MCSRQRNYCFRFTKQFFIPPTANFTVGLYLHKSKVPPPPTIEVSLTSLKEMLIFIEYRVNVLFSTQQKQSKISNTCLLSNVRPLKKTTQQIKGKHEKSKQCSNDYNLWVPSKKVGCFIIFSWHTHTHICIVCTNPPPLFQLVTS